MHQAEAKPKLQTAKFLMSNTAAGSIIGKGGSNINELQRTSNAKLQLSRPMEFFPGTNERVLTATGSIQQLTNVLEMILTACQEDIVRSILPSPSKHLASSFEAPDKICREGQSTPVNHFTFANQSVVLSVQATLLLTSVANHVFANAMRLLILCPLPWLQRSLGK